MVLRACVGWDKSEPRFALQLSHEEIGQVIGTSRETVTRLFSDLKKRQIVQANGSTLVIRNKSGARPVVSGHKFLVHWSLRRSQFCDDNIRMIW